LLTQNEIREKIKESNGWKKCGRILELTFLLLLPVLVFISTKASEWSAESALKDTKLEVIAESNRLTQVESKYDEATNDLAAAKQTAIEASNAENSANIAVLENLPRHLSNDQKMQLLKVIEPYPKLKFSFFFENSVNDSKRIENDLAQVFLSDGWEMEESEGGMMPIGDGIFLRSKESNDATTKAIADTLTSFGINTFVDKMRVFGNHSLTNMVFIIIGHKPQ
jgi:hypothetical protein